MIRAFNTLRLAALLGATALLVGCAADLDADDASIAESVSEALVVEAEDELTWREELDRSDDDVAESDDPAPAAVQLDVQKHSVSLPSGEAPSAAGAEVMGEPPPIPWYPCRQRETASDGPGAPHVLGASTGRTSTK